MTTIIHQLKEDSLKQQLQKFGIEHLRIFGSVAKGTHTKTSDIDLLYSFTNKDPSELDGRGLFSALPYLEEKLNKKIDLVNINSIDPLLEDEIIKTKQLVF